ncbi:alpha/beta fold hydrolase [Streptomyces sp. NBC_00690]|uniref:alpha/beta fold hydrolase n=1 Tax=Streptomyces sp. NBC_00690 TaxID=2975808 RepID=UPI002E2D0A72|nr:alpha/beta hydrolase [Streptomyces sp. NBC_00690]
MGSIYRSIAGREAISRWCTDRLDGWAVAHKRVTLTVSGVRTHVVTAGTGSPVLFLPGTNFNAAASLPLATALAAAGHRVILPDVPGQPGLSSGERGLAKGRLSWYGTWLNEVIEQTIAAPVTVMGHSFGAAVALSCHSPHIERLVLASPAGLTRLSVPPHLLAASTAWFLRPTPTSSARLLRAMSAPGRQPRNELVEWMTLVARHSRSSGAPGRAEPPSGQRCTQLAVTGANDVFLPPHRLRRAVRDTLKTELQVAAGAGHLLVEEHPELVANLASGDPQAAGEGTGDGEAGPAR